jgi:hypothetical protein
MSYLRNLDPKVHDLKSKDFNREEERRTLAYSLHHYVKEERNCNQQLKLERKTRNSIKSNISAEKQQYDYEDQKAIEFKAKALFELEQVIVEIEQFKQICK